MEGRDGTMDGGGGSRGPSLVLGIQSSSDSPRYWTVGVAAGAQVSRGLQTPWSGHEGAF